MTTPDVAVSDHAERRLLQYCDDTDEPLDAWRGGLPLFNHGFHGDEVRYDPKLDVVLVRKDTHITTIIDHEPSMRYQGRQAVAKAVALFGDERLGR